MHYKDRHSTYVRLATEGDTADGLATTPVISADWLYAAIIK